MIQRKYTTLWRIIFTQKAYFSEAAAIAVLFYMINVVIPNVTIIRTIVLNENFLHTIQFLFFLAAGFRKTVAFHSYISLITISILLGVLFTLITYKIRTKMQKQKKRAGVMGGISGSAGIFLSALAPGCAACGIGFVSVLGIGGGIIQLLPLDGFEFSLIAITLLTGTIIKITKDMAACKVCQV